MLQVYCGNDVERVRAAAIAAAHANTSGASSEVTITTIDADTFQPGMIADALGAVSLFGGEERYLLDMPSDTADFAAEVHANLVALAESTNVFVVIEGALLAAAKKPYQKHAALFEEYKKTSEQQVNPFALADSLAKKDKRTLWLQLQDMRHNGFPAEELIGILWWQLKSLRLAAQTNSAAEAGMKDFPYNKAKRSLSTFKAGELEALSESLLNVYHDGHNGSRDIDLALERWVLTL